MSPTRGEISAESILSALAALKVNKNPEAFIAKHRDGFRLLDEMGVGVFIWNYRNKELYYSSRAFLSILGIAESNLKPFEEVWSRVHPDDRLRLPQLLSKVLPIVETANIKNETELYIRFHYRIVTNGQGQQWVMSQHKFLHHDGQIIDLGTLTPLSISQIHPPKTLSIIIDGKEQTIHADDSAQFLERLNEREKEILELSLQGLSLTEIAEKTGLTISGVRYHRRKILRESTSRSVIELRRRLT